MLLQLWCRRSLRPPSASCRSPLGPFFMSIAHHGALLSSLCRHNPSPSTALKSFSPFPSTWCRHAPSNPTLPSPPPVATTDDLMVLEADDPVCKVRCLDARKPNPLPSIPRTPTLEKASSFGPISSFRGKLATWMKMPFNALNSTNVEYIKMSCSVIEAGLTSHFVVNLSMILYSRLLSVGSTCAPEALSYAGGQIAEFIVKGRAYMPVLAFKWWKLLRPLINLGRCQWIGSAIFVWGWLHQGSLYKYRGADEYVILHGRLVIYADILVASGGLDIKVWVVFFLVVCVLQAEYGCFLFL